MMADVVVDPECTDPKELYGHGVRAFILQDFEAAVAALSKASELLVAKHKDDLHESLGEVYLYYGKSLLGLAREQNEALGDAVPKNSAEDSEDNDDEDADNEEKQDMTESNNDTSDVNKAKSEETNGDRPASSSKQNGEPGSSSVNSGNIEETNDQPGEEETADGQNDEEEPSDLQVAWEVLELAKKIFQNKDEKKNLSETLIVLGEVSLESENFQSAINDIKQGLDIQKELYSKDSRSVAETFYKLGIAYSTNTQIDEAVDSFNTSLEYLKNRIKTLEDIKLMSQENKDEIEEIQGLIPDIEEKISDMILYKEEAIKKINQAIKEPLKSSTDGAGSSKQVTDITHLVKRKRKIDEVTAEDTPEVQPAKKISPPSQ